MSLNNAGHHSAPPWYGRIRWQLALTYLFGGGLSVLLLGAFAWVAVNMLIVRGSINTVERQIDLMVQLAVNRLELVTSFALLQPSRQTTGPERGPGAREGWRDDRRGDRRGPAAAEGQPPPPRGGAGGGGGRGSGQSARSLITCPDSKRNFPPGSQLTLPAWLKEDSFSGVTIDSSGAVIRAFSRNKSGECTVEVLVESPVTEHLAETIASASGLDVTMIQRNRNAAPKGLTPKRTPPSIPEMAWRELFGRFERGNPAMVPIVDWQSGEMRERPLFLVKPNADLVWTQLTRLGTRQRPWVWGLALLALGVLLAEALAIYLAMRLARRIVRSIDLLSTAATRVGAGDLSHRVPVASNDQLGRLGSAFNEMTASLERLLEQTRKQERVEEEIRIAREVQESLLPQSLPELVESRLAAICRPARNVSGDIYDVIPIGPGRVGLLCADVSGKGIPAALVTSTVQALVRVLLHAGNGVVPAPSELLTRINSELYRRIPTNSFVTLFWADFDSSSRLLRWSSAGHCPSLLLTGDRTEWLSEGGLPAGMFDRSGYPDQQFVMPAGSLLLAYTDGVIEAERHDGEAYGEERLAEICRAHAGEAPGAIIDRIVESVREWSGASEPSDDLTLLALQT